MTGQVREIKEPEKLVFSANAIQNGKVFLEHLTTVTFEEEDAKTKMTVHVVVTKAYPGSEAALAGMEQGWSQSFDKLTEVITK